jgi:alanine racemase
MFIIKANAYGHGVVDAAEIAYAAGIRHFGCLEIETAVIVRALLDDPDVSLLAWQFSDHDELALAAVTGVELGVGSTAQLDILENARIPGVPFRVHLKVDTGLNRNGVPEADWGRFIGRVVGLEKRGIVRSVGVWTHIAETDDAADAKAHADFSAARTVAEGAIGRPLFAHLAASSASFRLPDFRFDAVRIGGHAYGIPSFDDITPHEMGLEPVMTLVAPSSPTHHPTHGSVVRVEAGFVDGVPGYAVGAVSVTIDGQRCPIVEVNEDHLFARNPGVSAAGIARLFGPGDMGEQTVREWGDALGTLGDEITCRIPASVTRIVGD